MAQIDELIRILLLVYCICAVQSQRAIEIHKFETMPGSDAAYIDWGSLRLARARERKSLAVSGTFYFLRNVKDEEFAYSVYGKNPVTRQFPNKPLIQRSHPFCEFMETDKLFYPDIVKASNLPPPGTCPLPKGNYTLNNYLVSEEKLKNLPSGDYKIILSVTKNRKFITGIECLASLG